LLNTNLLIDTSFLFGLAFFAVRTITYKIKQQYSSSARHKRPTSDSHDISWWLPTLASLALILSLVKTIFDIRTIARAQDGTQEITFTVLFVLFICIIVSTAIYVSFKKQGRL